MIDNGLILDIRIAEKYSVEEAIVIAKLFAWIKHNALNGKNYHDGRYWTFNSLSAFAKYFPFWSESKVKRILIDLYGGIDKKDTQPKHEQIILKGNFNKNPYDKTVWYSFTDDFFKYLLSLGYANLTDFPISENGVSEIDQSDIPIADEQYQYNKTKKEDNNPPLTPQGGEQGSLFPDEEEPKKSETKTKKLKKPTVEEVTEYCRKIEFQIDAEDFIDYYDSVGWVVGKTAKPMKDWKAAVRTWKRNRQKNTRINQTNDTDVYEYDTNGNKIKKQDWQ